jgi:hypothetical protein
MRNLLSLLLLAALILPGAGGLLAQEPPELPVLDEMRRGWTILEPGGETVCARETPFNFFVRKTDQTDKLMIYFQGGGACWNAFLCRDGGPYDDAVSYWGVEVGAYRGIFDVRNESNPLRDYNVVYIPYCTGDVHVGDESVRYLGSTIEHRGAVNAQAALDWAYANFSAPEQIVVAGTSAGADRAIYFTADIAEQYPDSRIIQFGDAGVGATPRGWPVLQTWGMFDNMHDYLTEVDPETFDVNVLYSLTAEKFPNVTLAEFTNANDETQAVFYNFAGISDAPAWQDVMYGNLAVLEEQVELFTSYVAGGSGHTILVRDTFYTLTSNGVPFVEWFTALINGELPESVRCEQCDTAEYLR